MKATKYQKALAEYLKKQGLSLELASTIPTILESEELVKRMLVWVGETEPTEEQIMHWIVEHT